MRIVSRNDVVLVGALALALFVGLSSRVGALLDYVQDGDRTRGFRLLPALVVLTGVFIVHLLKRRQEMRAANLQAMVFSRVAQTIFRSKCRGMPNHTMST